MNRAKITNAIELVGGQDAVAKLYHPPIKQQSVSGWVRRGAVPANRIRVLIDAANRAAGETRFKPQDLNAGIEDIINLVA